MKSIFLALNRILQISYSRSEASIDFMRTGGWVLPGSRKRKLAIKQGSNNGQPSDNRVDEAGTSSHVGLQAGQRNQQGEATLIDVDAIDDEVILSPPRAYPEAQNSGSAVALDVDSGNTVVIRLAPDRRKRRRIRSIINIDDCINLESNSYSTKEKDKKLEEEAKKLIPPKPAQPSIECPICLSTFVEPMSTKCGHIFCKSCIQTAIAAKAKCPTCRKKVTKKDIIRVFLPTPS